MSRICIFEDSLDHQRLMQASLSPGHEVSLHEDLSQFIAILEKSKPDLIILDVEFPTGTGFEACSELQSHPHLKSIPLLFVSARNQTKDIITGLSLGAEDYISKPFDPQELRARVENKLLKRKKAGNTSEIIERGALRIDLQTQTASIAPQYRKINLTRLEFKILSFLARHEGKVISREELLESLWSEGHQRIFDRSVDTHMSSIRRKCKEIAHYITSVYGSGYRFDTQANQKTQEIKKKNKGY